MRNKAELNDIALEWAYQTLEVGQHEWDYWDNLVIENCMSDEEWDYCKGRNFTISILNEEK